MRKNVFKLIRISGIPYLFRKIFQRNHVTILMFHDIKTQQANKLFKELSNLYNFIDLNLFIKAAEWNNKKLLPPYSMIITFDDGHILNYDLLPIFKNYNISPTIFLCAGIINSYRHYWFKYNQSMIPNSHLVKMPNEERLNLLKQIGYIQNKDYSYPQALSKEQIDDMRGFVNFQSHTIFHPCLTKCDYSETKNEIEKSKDILEKEYNLKINALAYPNGDYSEREIKICKLSGYKCAITIEAGYNSIKSDLYKLKRFSSNDTDDINELLVKASGFWGLFKSFFLFIKNNIEQGFIQNIKKPSILINSHKNTDVTLKPFENK